MTSPLLAVLYDLGDTAVFIDCINTDMSMTPDEALDLCGVDMDVFASDMGWDGWDPCAVYLRYGPADIVDGLNRGDVCFPSTWDGRDA